MRTLILLAALALAPAAHAQTLDDLTWLKGCWRTQGSATEITEVWSAPPMPALVGYSYTTRDGQIRGWEQTRIEIIEGVPTFVAMPSGDTPVRFQMLPDEQMIHLEDQPDGSASFVNPEHDFPQRITYVRNGRELTAAISAMDGSNRIAFEYRRISCSAALRP
jgi:hypothetical protein